MKEFSKLALRQAGQMTAMSMILAATIAGGAIFGIVEIKGEMDYRDALRATAAQMAQASEISLKDKIGEYFQAEAGRIEEAHTANLDMLAKLGDESDEEGLGKYVWALKGQSGAGELAKEEQASYASSKERLAKERESAGRVWEALAHPGEISLLKQGLSKENLEIYSSVKDCAARGAGQGAYCGRSQAMGLRISKTMDEAKALKDEAETYARGNLAAGWNDWDGAAAALKASALKEIAETKAQAQSAYMAGDLSEEDWKDMQKGFDAAQATASQQIDKDKEQLSSRAHSGGLTFWDYYLISHWMNSSPQTQSLSSGGYSAAAYSGAYAPGGSAYKPVAPAPSMGQKLAMAKSPVEAQAAAAPSALGKRTASFAMPQGSNPYAIKSGSSPLGQKAAASFESAAGSRIAQAMRSAGPAGGRPSGLGARISGFARAASAAHASSGAHAGVSHASSAHGSSGG